jgi:hypothetical protein
MFRASILLTHNSTDRKGCLVADGVKVGWVGVRVCVTVMVGVEVAVGGSVVAVCVAVGDDASEGVAVTVGVSSGGGFVRGIRKKASSRIIVMRAGIPNLRNHGGRESIAF